MANQSKVDSILDEILELNKDDRTYLLNKLLELPHSQISNISENKEIKLSDLKGVGSEIWKDVDPDRYVENERRWN